MTGLISRSGPNVDREHPWLRARGAGRADDAEGDERKDERKKEQNCPLHLVSGYAERDFVSDGV